MKTNMKKGFTLVEMMIVVAIIAVLAGVAIPQYTKYIKKAETVEAVGILKQIIDAEVIYKATNSDFLVLTPTTSATGLVKFGIEIPEGTDFEAFLVSTCAKTGNTAGIIVQTKKTNSKPIYSVYPVNMTLSAAVNLTGSSYIDDYISGDDGVMPQCP